MGHKDLDLRGKEAWERHPYRFSPLPHDLRLHPEKEEKKIAFVLVRNPKQIPSSLLAYFKFHPRQRRPLNTSEKQLYAQVYLHEIEEGARVLARHHQKKQAEVLTDFENSMHPEQRLDLLRQLLRHPILQSRKPEFSAHYKIRHNQWGAVQGHLGPHPCIAYTSPGMPGKVRNEDAFLILPREGVVAIADGMGGSSSGEVASCIAIDFFEESIQRGLTLQEALSYANEAILLRQQSERNSNSLRPMGSTLSALQLKGNMLRVAHMGDTKVAVLRKGELVWESLDHTKGQQLYREGLVDEDTALELNHILMRCLGHDSVQPERDVDYSEIPLQKGDRILIMSDGITDNFFDSGFKLSQLFRLASQPSLNDSLREMLLHWQGALRKRHLPNGRIPKIDNISLALIDYRG